MILPILLFNTLTSQFLSFFPESFSTIHKDAPPTLFDLPYQQQTMGAVSLVDQDTWVFTFVMAMNDYVSNLKSKQMLLHCNYKISTLVLQIHIPFHIIDEVKTETPILQWAFIWLINIRNWLTKCVGRKFHQLNLLNGPCLPHFVVHSFPNAIMHGHTWVMGISVAKKREYCVKRVNKANRSPSKVVFCYFYFLSLLCMHNTCISELFYPSKTT